MSQHDPIRFEEDGRTWFGWLGDDGRGGRWEVIGHLADDEPDLLVITRAQRFQQTFAEEG